MFAESINTDKGFFGKPCGVGILSYLTGISRELCPFTGNKNLLARAGEYVSPKAHGTFKIETNFYPPLARGIPLSDIHNQMLTII
ncbi:unnamed protein product [Nezara viridula]|uniref:Uncharacterized protein n=1 Tax=Nezara viridula TaxID=85310 RepID=A0A9P0HME2_NEZVI|nr:unnamed protein product [Nezara viridula]